MSDSLRVSEVAGAVEAGAVGVDHHETTELTRH